MKSLPRPLVMRIITRLAGGGPPVHATILNRQLAKHGFDSLLVFGDCSPTEKNMEYLVEAGDQTERIPTLGGPLNPLLDLVALYQLWRLMRRYRPSIVHTHTAKAGFLGRIAAAFAGCPCVVHTYHGHVLEGYFGPALNQILRWTERILSRYSHALCTVSEQQAVELSSRFAIAPANKFHVVPLGIYLDPYLAIPAPDFKATRLTIGWMGRFVPIKNLRLLAQVIELTSRRQLPIDFLIAGDGPERAQFEESIRILDLEHIRLLPWQDHVESVLQRCHLMILTSHREGTPLALIQGMAAGRPFVSTPAGGTVDLTVGFGRFEAKSWWYENAVLVSGDAEAFVSVLERLLERREILVSMSESSRILAQKAFPDTRLVSDVAALYRELLMQQEMNQAQMVEQSQ